MHVAKKERISSRKESGFQRKETRRLTRSMQSKCVKSM